MGTIYKQIRLPSDISAASQADLSSLAGTVSGVQGSISGLPALEEAVGTLQDEVALLLYDAPSITAFTNSVNTTDLGVTVSSVTFNWTVTGSVALVSQSISDGVGAVTPATLRTVQKTGLSLTSNTTLTLSVDDGTAYAGHAATRTSTISFLNRMYWGTYATKTLQDAPQNALNLANADFASSRAKTVTINGGGNYIYFCYPASFGDAVFTVGGLRSTAWTKYGPISLTNAYGHQENYYFYVSDAIQNGDGINIVIS